LGLREMIGGWGGANGIDVVVRACMIIFGVAA
jgi:hypothetical protein